MVKTAEMATRNYALGALKAFLQGKKDLKWFIGMIRSSGVEGTRLAEIFEILRECGNSQRYEEAAAACRKLGWLV